MFVQIRHKEGYPPGIKSIVINHEALKILIWELPFWFSVAVWCLLPTTRTPWLWWGDIRLNGREILVSLTAGFYTLLLLDALLREKQILLRHRSVRIHQGAWDYHLPLATFLILTYLALSVTWSDLNERTTRAMLYTLAGAGSAFFIGYAMSAKRDSSVIHGFLWRLTIFMAALGLLYSSESFFSVGLRSETFSGGEFGIERVKGPLFAASTGFFVLIPPLAFVTQEILRDRRQLLLKGSVLFALALTLLGLGSRAGLLLLALYAFSLLLFLQGKQRLLSMLTFGLVVVAAGIFVFSNARTDRLRSGSDGGRGVTHRVAMQIITNRSMIENLAGSGYGSYWKWYLQEADYPDEIHEEWKAYHRGVRTPYGRMLYHPHSTFLLFAVEGGTVGLLYFALLWSVLLRLVIRGLKTVTYRAFSLGVAICGFGVFFDFFFFKTPQLNVFWWVYLFGALALSSGRNLPARMGEQRAA